MNIQIISDIHQEFGYLDLYFDRADLIIFAGDIHIGTKGLEWMKLALKDIPIIYVLGNHEYYKGSYPKTLQKITEAAQGTNIHILDNESIELEGVRFHGATLWTDFALFGDSRTYGILCQNKMSDYKQIRKDPSYSKIRSIDTYKWHQISKLWLEKSLNESSAKTNIVVTHHAPSILSIPSQLRTEPMSSAYASSLDDIILQYAPEYWIHGHIHTPSRYKIGKTEIICNPHGYIDEKDNGFDRELIIEV